MKANYLASPPLVVAYALAGRMDIDLVNEPLGQDPNGDDVYLRDLWPSAEEIQRDDRGAPCAASMFSRTYADVFTGDDGVARAARARRRALRVGSGLDLRAPAAVLRRDVAASPGTVDDIEGARCLVMARRLGDDRPHLAGRLRSSRTRRPASTSSSTASSARTSTRTARGAATTR